MSICGDIDCTHPLKVVCPVNLAKYARTYHGANNLPVRDLLLHVESRVSIPDSVSGVGMSVNVMHQSALI